MSDAGEILEKAAEIVEAGWCQGKLSSFKPNGVTARCVLGAVDTAGFMRDGDAHRRACELLSEFAKIAGYDRAGAWNDAPGRTAGEVASVLRKLAREASE